MLKKKAKKKSRASVKLLDIDDVYRLINRAQINKKKVNLPLSHEDAVIVENIIKDTGLKYSKKELKKRVTFVVHPSGDPIEDDLEFDIDFFEDEILDVGQIF